MAIYVVLSAAPSPKLQANIEKLFPGDEHYDLAPQQWLVSTSKVSATINQELGIADGKLGLRVAIFRIAGTGFGWHAKTLWEWLEVKSKA
jgi:hypothetical protein